jgi:iron complex outermembrane receptor protein/outer membrane receptor for ferrienterochelin and colicins
VEPLSDSLITERSYGANFDFNFSKDLGDWSFGLNQLFFLTNIIDPLVLQENASEKFMMVNASDPVQTKGFETNLRIIYKSVKLFSGYTYLNARATYLSGQQFLTLTPRNKLNIIFLLEKSGNYKMGLEGYWTDHQYLSTGDQSPSFWEFGFFAEKTFNVISVFVNFENFTDTRQNNFGPVVAPPHEQPIFSEVYTHTEGFVLNGGVKLRL